LDSLLDILQLSSWNELPLILLDVAFVYYIIYRILLLIKGTRAAQMLLGLLLVILFFFLSGQNLLDLRITNWFLDKFIANFIIIIVIIFQDDIRRALAQAGSRTSFFSRQRSIQESYVLEEIIKASTMLSKRQLGGLIAIEREASLNTFIEEGITLDSTISKDLLFSVFLPEHQNPLHDGAVIVQQGRISAAGCVLPLSQNARVPKSLGTRHRAAIGLSEDYDAAVVVVSEETGQVSVAYKGELYRELEVIELRELLQNIYLTKANADERASLKEIVAKLGALGKTSSLIGDDNGSDRRSQEDS
jgi:diadenylate cyclase